MASTSSTCIPSIASISWPLTSAKILPFGMKISASTSPTRSLLIPSSFRPSLRRLITHQPEVFVPHPRECRNLVLDLSSPNRYAGMHNIAPRSYFRPFGSVFKRYPLPERHSDRMVDPADPFSRRAARYYVVHDRIHRVQQLDLHPASRLPWLPFPPSNFPINVGKIIPASPVREYFPGNLGTGLCYYT